MAVYVNIQTCENVVLCVNIYIANWKVPRSNLMPIEWSKGLSCDLIHEDYDPNV